MEILSKWGENLDQSHPLWEYPRMQLQRDSYMSLNGIWEYQITGKNEATDPLKWKKIVVPFALGSKLSGTEDELEPGKVLWYRRQFAYKPTLHRTLLHFEAVDQCCTVFVNGLEAGSHQGGYGSFSFDVSELVKYQNSLMVRITDSSDQGNYAYGKQKIDHGGMWYTPSSGIWQSVWLEDLPDHAVEDVKITPDLDGKVVYFSMLGNFAQAAITISMGNRIIHRGMTNDMYYTAEIPEIHEWTPDDPFLYDVYIQTEDDLIQTYFGMRKFSVERDSDGYSRFFLNNKPLFVSGILDQGYSVDGLLTYPSDEAIVYELTKIKEMGFNMVRKHVKVDMRRWYYHCDRLGLLVMQDMPNGGPFDFKEHGLKPTLGMRKQKEEQFKIKRSDKQQRIYYHELGEMLDRLYNCVSVFCWVPFNEGWGQFDTAGVTEYIRDYDTTRLVDSASGWFDTGCGDFLSIHDYFFPFHPKMSGEPRALILSEFGGYAYIEYGHSIPEKVYGYRKFKDKIQLDQAIAKLYEKMIYNNIPKGLAGCVYTQVSDVEDECNGLFTADRKIIKVDVKKMRKMNERIIKKGSR